MKKIYKLLFAVLITGLFSCSNSKSIQNNSQSIKSALINMSSMLNKDAPIEVNPYMSLTSSMVVGDNEIKYFYKISSEYMHENLKLIQFKWLGDEKKFKKNYYCTEENMKWFRDNNVRVTYKYDFSDGFEGVVSVTPDDCN